MGPLKKHENADTLSITEVDGRPVITRTGEYQEGDLAVYVPIDSVVPENDPRWEFLAGHRRIKAKKLRGTFSMGLLTKPEPEWKLGDDVRELLRIEVYEPAMNLSTGLDNEPDPGFMPCYTDIESLRKYKHLFTPELQVVATEKVHGANGRFLFRQDRLWCGSRTGIKREDPRSIWWEAARTMELEKRLSWAPNIAVYGEVYGQVQDLKYGVQSGVRFIAFDAFDTIKGQYLNYDRFVDLMEALQLPLAPVLYRGPFSGLGKELAEGLSVVGNGTCIREGFVVRPLVEQWDAHLGRVICKLVGEGYHLRKGG